MNYLKYILLFLSVAGIYSGSIQAMQGKKGYKKFDFAINFDTGGQSRDIIPVLKRFFTVKQKDDSRIPLSTINTLPPIRYRCVPNKKFDFTNLIYQLYNAGFNRCTELSEQSKKKLLEKLNNLELEKEALDITNQDLAMQLSNKVQDQEKSDEQCRNALSKNTQRAYFKANSYALLKNFGCGIAGACIALGGAWLYNLYTR